MVAGCALVNRVRIARGWNVLPVAEGELAARVWIDLLDTEDVPPSAYDELFKMAVRANANKRSQGVQPPEITPEYLLGFWVGSEGLKTQMRGIRDAEYGTDSARVECGRCGGTGFEPHAVDGYRGVVRCAHGGK